MFNNSANIVISGGTFTVQNRPNPDVRHPRRNNSDSYTSVSGLDILYKHIATDAMHDSAERSNAPACHPGTRTAILADIRSWIVDKHRKTTFLWIHGPAGSGKTAICQTLATQCEDGDLAATFFFEGGSSLRDDARLLITTIAYQIANNIGSAKAHISDAVLKSPQLIFEKTTRIQLRDLIIKPLQRAAADSSNVDIRSKLVLIDGLDECRPQESQEEILRVIHDAATRSLLPLCIIISSRREPHLRDAFEGYLRNTTRTIALDGTLNPDEDIGTYLRSSFADILHKHRYHPVLRSLDYKWPPESTIQTIVTKASGQFIYATTAVRFVDVRDQTPMERLEIVMELVKYGKDVSYLGEAAPPFSELDQLYQKVFEAVYDIPLTLRILGCVILLRAPINVSDLETLLQLEPGTAEISLAKLHSVLDIFDDPSDQDRFVRFHHESLKDFLLNPRRSGRYHIASDSIHRELSRRLSPYYRFGGGYSLTPCAFSIPLFHNTTAQSYYQKCSQVSSSNSAALLEWIYHMSMLDSDSLDRELFAFRGTSAYRVTRMAKKPTEQYICYTDRSPELNSIIDQLSILVNNLKQCSKNENSDIINAYTNALDLHFQNHLAAFDVSSEIQFTTLPILAMFMQDTLSTPPAAFGLLLHLDWSGFVGATLPLRNFMSFRPSIKYLSQAFAEFIADPDRCEGFNPMSDAVHADLAICCLEFIKNSRFSVNSGIPFLLYESQSYTDSGSRNKALRYAEANWREHLNRGNAQRLLSYIYFVADRDGYPPPPCKIHNQLSCNDSCKVIRVIQCIERAKWIIDLGVVEPSNAAAGSSIVAEYLDFFGEIIETKYMNTPHFLSLKVMIHKWTQGFDSTILDISDAEALLNERSEILRKSDSAKFPYSIQGVLWAARRGYSGKLPLTSQKFGSGRALPVPIPRHLARQHAAG